MGIPQLSVNQSGHTSIHPLGWTMLKYVIFLLPLVAGQQLSSQPRRITANVRRIVGPAASDPVVGRLQEVGNSVNFGAPNINSNIDVTNEDGRFALSADLDFNDMSDYFFNAMILMGVTIFPNLTSMLENT